MHYDEALRAITGRHGVFFRREAIEVGLTDRQIADEVRRGRLVKVRHGTYAFADDWGRLAGVERLATQTRGVVRGLGPVVAASHHSAAALHGMDLWGVPLETVHVTRLDGGAGRTESGVTHHEGVCLGDEVVSVEGTPAVRPVRAALESASLSDVERGLVTVDSGLRQGLFTPSELTAQYELMQSWPGTQHLQLVSRLADGGSGSVGESRSRFLCWSHGLPMPTLQFEVYDGSRLVGVTDFAWEEYGLLGEFDGRVKYGRYLRPGEDPGDAVFREKRREDEIRRLTGWRIIRLTWADLANPARTAERIRSMLALAA
jgi:hypothetical protein